jgi:hypothetical protein
LVSVVGVVVGLMHTHTHTHTHPHTHTPVHARTHTHTHTHQLHLQRRKHGVDKNDEREGEEDGGHAKGVGDLWDALEDGEEEEIKVGHLALGAVWFGGLCVILWWWLGGGDELCIHTHIYIYVCIHTSPTQSPMCTHKHTRTRIL